MAIIRSRDGTSVLDTTEVLLIIQVARPNGAAFRITQEQNISYRCPVREEIVPIFYLREGASDSNDSFDAHFCPYAPDRVFGIRLDETRDYFFTATLTGCTLGFGALAEDGSRWVGHSNAQDIGGRMEELLGGDENSTLIKSRIIQQRVQTQMLRQIEPTSAPLNPPSYGQSLSNQGGISTTVMGFRNTIDNKWTFIRQTYNSSDFV